MNRKVTLALCLLGAFMLFVGAGCTVNSSHDSFGTPSVGRTATFQRYPYWNISGTVTVVDSRTLRVDDFSFHGDMNVTAEIRLQKNFNKVATLKDITDQTFDHASFPLTIPDAITLDDFDVVTVFSPAFNSAVSGAAFK